MPRGAPDYSNVRAYGPLHRLDDMAELAARLGSPVVYDRAGQVVWFTDFEHGLQGSVITVDHENSEGIVSASRSFRGAYSLKMHPRAAASSRVSWIRLLHHLPAGDVGAEIAISLDTDPLTFELNLSDYAGDDQTQAVLKYLPATGNWEVGDNVLGWVGVLSGFSLYPSGGAWYPVKLIADFVSKKYVKVLIGEHVIDLSDYFLVVDPEVSPRQLTVGMTVRGNAATHAPVWIDGIIVTQNEP